MDRLPPLNGLRAFDAAGRYLNFRSAADRLGVTQGAVAQQVRQLEAHLGMPLFERLPKGLAFTSAGRSYHARVAAAFEELRTATEGVMAEPDRVSVSLPPTFAARWMVPNLVEFAAAHPNIELRVLSTEKLLSFHADGVDVVVRLGLPPAAATLDVVRLFRQNVIAVCSPKILEGRGLPLSGEELAELPCLHDSHDAWPEFFERLGLRDRGRRGLRFSQAALAVDAAVAGQGVALISRFLVARELAEGSLVQVMPQILERQQNYYLLAQKGPSRRPAVEAVFQWLKSRAEPEA